MDMIENIELPIDRVQKLFNNEVINGINTGSIKLSNIEAFTEIYKSLDLSDSNTAAILYRLIEY